MSVFSGVNGHLFQGKVNTFSSNLLHRLSVAPRFGLKWRSCKFHLNRFMLKAFVVFFILLWVLSITHLLVRRISWLGLYQVDWLPPTEQSWHPERLTGNNLLSSKPFIASFYCRGTPKALLIVSSIVLIFLSGFLR